MVYLLKSKEATRQETNTRLLQFHKDRFLFELLFGSAFMATDRQDCRKNSSWHYHWQFAYLIRNLRVLYGQFRLIKYSQVSNLGKWYFCHANVRWHSRARRCKTWLSLQERILTGPNGNLSLSPNNSRWLGTDNVVSERRNASWWWKHCWPALKYLPQLKRILAVSAKLNSFSLMPLKHIGFLWQYAWREILSRTHRTPKCSKY